MLPECQLQVLGAILNQENDIHKSGRRGEAPGLSGAVQGAGAVRGAGPSGASPGSDCTPVGGSLPP